MKQLYTIEAGNKNETDTLEFHYLGCIFGRKVSSVANFLKFATQCNPLTVVQIQILYAEVLKI
jgi:hypothetical protein